MPGMSDSDEYQFWRIMKVGSDDVGEHIKEGDQVRLCWAFADQTTGFRDYSLDAFGRRRNQCPPELESDVLFMKMPWPRFENSGTAPNSMVMSPLAGAGPRVMDIKTAVRDAGYKYVVEDITFRIDTVANGGYGDAEDYLLRGLLQEGTKVTLDFRRKANGVLGPVYSSASAFLL